MTAASLGQKHQCRACSTRFYDLNKSPATCPKCGLEVVMDAADVSAVMAPSEPAPEAYDEDALLKVNVETQELDDDFDAIETLDEDDEDEIESLSELDDRETVGMHAGHDDDVDEDTLMDDLDHDVILDDASECNEDELRA